MQDLNDEMAAEDQSPRQEFPCQSPLSVESIASMTASIVSEEKEREKRKLNLIIHNYPEPTSTDYQARKKEDIEYISILLNKYVNVPTTITNAIRIGKQCDRPRLTKITVSTIEKKPSTLRNRQNLRKKAHPSHVQKVFVTPDLTPTQQKRTNRTY